MGDSINLYNREELMGYYRTCVTLQVCLIDLNDQMTDDHINHHLNADEDFRDNVKNLLEEHAKQFADFMQSKFKGQTFVYRRTISDQELINEFLNKKYKEYKEWEAYKESRPDLFD